MPVFSLDNVKKVYFIGIGGIGVSSIARILLTKGVKVSGSDLFRSSITDDLKRLGISINIGEHKAENISKDIDLLIYTVATKNDNPELMKAKELNIKTLTYPQILGQISRKKYTICVSGTHGKTTTTAMTALLLERGGMDPTVVVGSNIKQYNGNARLGKSKYFVIEADEYRRAFLNYYPNIIILTNIEFEHPDCYQDINDLLGTFRKYIKRLPKDGILVANADDKNILRVAKAAHCRVILFGIKNKSANILAENIAVNEGRYSYRISGKPMKINNIDLIVPGRHNIYNSLGAAIVAKELSVSDKSIIEGLKLFRGTWRRFELRINALGITVIDDYAHHPTEIRATLRAAKEKYPHSNIICVFQPHHKERTKKLYSDFISSFKDADELIIADIYEVAGREENIKISSSSLAEDVRKRGIKAVHISKLKDIKKELVAKMKRGDVIITMGAGDITTVADDLVEILKKRQQAAKVQD